MIFISMQQQKCNLLLMIVFIILSTIALTGRSSAVEISCDGTSQLSRDVVRTYLSYFISIDTDPEEEEKGKTVRSGK